MPGGQPLRLGPFIGGLNTLSDPTVIADAELAECLNMELDVDGSLVSRTPFKEFAGAAAFTERVLLLTEAIFSGVHYIIASNINGVFHYRSDTNAWVTITTTFQASVAVQYADTVYLVAKPGSANPGGKWDPVGGFTAIAAIPQGQAAVIHKERLFIAPGIDSTTNTSRLKFSDAGNFEVWGASNFVDISQGDGTKLIDLTVFQDNLLLFKHTSSYVLAYDVRPTDAVVRKISLTIGVDGQFNVINYENQVYIFNGGWVYEIINYDFQRLNTKVPFIRDDTAPTPFSNEKIFLSLLGDRLICRFYRNVYVYGLRTRTWSEWESESNKLHYFGPILTIRPPTGDEYYSGACLSANLSLIKFIDKATTTNTEQSFSTTVTVSDTFTRNASSSWGVSDSGHTYTNSGGAGSDYSVNGTLGLHSLGSVSVFRSSNSSMTAITDMDVTGTIATDKLATGASQRFAIRVRRVDSSNFYWILIDFTTAQAVNIALLKTAAGVETTLAGAVAVGGLVHAANTRFAFRARIQGTVLSGKVWLASASEPAAWNLTISDNAISSPGTLELASALVAGNTNVLPVVASWDSISLINMAYTSHTINCRVLTKNFDMAISHQFKRLWWWGADVSTDNDITGIATPIILSFNTTWSALSSSTWGSLSTSTWGQPLTTASSVETVATTGTGTARRFAKFMKSLRYRQINFAVELTTNGSTTDGPARLFSMTIITESKQVVSKSVS